MELADFDYDLPDERIAQTPIEPRDSARLLVAGDPIRHLHVTDLPDLLLPGDLVVVNETRVIPARLKLKRATGGAAEVLLLEATNGARTEWEALVRPGKKLRIGEELLAGDRPLVRIGERTEAGDTFSVTLLGPTDGATSLDTLETHGEMPLPPYITARLDDPERYQTVYAREPGSAAAPTAGLHFTPELFERLDERGIRRAAVELVVGLVYFSRSALTIRSFIRCIRSGTGYRRRRCRRASTPAPQAVASSRLGRPQCGRSNRLRSPASYRAGPSCSFTKASTGNSSTC